MEHLTRERIEQLRRSASMLRSNQPALNRDDALELYRHVQALDAELRRLQDGLRDLLDD